MNAIKRTLRNLSFAYFFKNYVFAALIAAVLFYYAPMKDAPTISLIIINFIFYPFAVCVWDNLRDLFFGNLYLWATGTFILLLFGIKILIK
ncbi:hypothetical protein DMB95_06705 [Campylobacter sp. MIT 12-8780]|uniref:hypothetical protein n=1 Tax=unclassified Campylobacter TaxID=2593542 RepID=UPI00115CB073|nr:MULTISPECIES: hypothetical protein [unclassified Campylobacter]NDJ27655.1 hypothetical protein [Campylobacter sp. MIT 19-121]TQR40819.1 hypothetical protein DMB95_06705 [Campylobacter sp. MIT 12-8780]